MEKLSNTFFYNLEKTVKIYRQFFLNQFKKHGFEITLDQWLILNTIIDYPEATQNEIAEMVFKDKASVTRIIELLVKNEYLTREIHPTNRRMFKLTITPKGQETLEQSKDLVQKIRRTALGEISDAEISTAQNILKKITENSTLIDEKQ